MKKLNFVWLLLLLSCSKILPELEKPAAASSRYPGYTDYRIKAGEHYAEGNVIKEVKKSSLYFNVIFDSSCVYQTVKAENQLDINKLYGFSDCNSAHHENSARFGWRWNGKSIDVLAYCYVQGKRMDKLLGTAIPGKTYDLSIVVEKNQYLFYLGDKKQVMPRYCGDSPVSGYQLYPYFGGDETAPHEMHIYISETSKG